MVFKRSKGILSIIFSLVLVFSTLSFSFAAQAKTTSELREEQSRIQKEIDAAQNKIDALAAEKKETEEYLVALREKISLKQDEINSLEDSKAALQAEINSIEDKIEKTEQQLIQIQEEIDKKQKEFDDTYELYCQRLRAMYVSGSVSNLEVLLTCPDMSSMLTRSQMIKSVSQQDSEILDDLMRKMEEIEEQKKELEVKRNELNEDKNNLESDKKELQENIDKIEASKRVLDDEAAECNALMRKLSSQTSEYLEMIETNEEELREIENEIRAAANAASQGSGQIPGSTGNGSGQLGYPTDSRSVSAGFPYYSSGGWHGGIDFPVPTGSNVYAAASGTVILVKYLTYSYGYYVMIDHGNGLSTLYAHNSAINVSVGESVSRGQVIAQSGSTGNSTGPHCHFEVRVNGTQVNPYNYL